MKRDIENLTASDIFLEDLGLTVPALGVLDGNSVRRSQIRDSADFWAHLQAGDLRLVLDKKKLTDSAEVDKCFSEITPVESEEEPEWNTLAMKIISPLEEMACANLMLQCLSENMTIQLKNTGDTPLIVCDGACGLDDWGVTSNVKTLGEESSTDTIVRAGYASSQSAAGQSSLSFSYTLVNGGGNNRLVIVGVSFEHSATSGVASITFAGVEMTELETISFPASGYTNFSGFYYLLDSQLPTSPGSKQISITTSSSISARIFGFAAEYSGVNQAAPDDYASHSNSASGSTSVSLTAASAGSLAFLMLGTGGTTTPIGHENNISTIVQQMESSSGAAIGEILGVSGGFTFGYNNLDTREGCIGAVWKPKTTTAVTNYGYELCFYESVGVITRKGVISSQSENSGVASHSFNYTLVNGTGNNRLVVVAVCYEATPASVAVTHVTFAGVEMTRVAASPSTAESSSYVAYTGLYYLLDNQLPATGGSKAINITTNASVTRRIMAYAVEYSGVKQSAPDDSAMHENPASGSTAVSLTAAAPGSIGILAATSGGFTSPIGKENNLSTIANVMGALGSSVSALGELTNRSGGFTFGYNSLSTREGCVGAVWQPASGSALNTYGYLETPLMQKSNSVSEFFFLASEEIPSGTSITNKVSFDGGTTWHTLVAGQTERWTEVDGLAAWTRKDQIKIRIELNGDGVETPMLRGFFMIYRLE